MILNSATGNLYYEVTGNGAPLVFISGWAMSADVWRPAVASLAANHRCLIYDLRGMARSQPASIEARFNIEDHVDDLHAILQAENIFDAIFVAHEMGALIAEACATKHPQDVAAMVFVSPRASFSKDTIKSLAVFTPASLMLRDIASFPVVRNFVAFRFRQAPPQYRDQLFNDFAELSPRAAYETALSASEGYETSPLEKFVKGNQLPILLVCGDEDKKALAHARTLFDLADDAKLATLRDCGFLPMLEYPQQFARLIESFAESAVAASVKMIRRN
ncbi:MAG: alpha/beta hydrolase [Acidobacteriota bacterium]